MDAEKSFPRRKDRIGEKGSMAISFYPGDIPAKPGVYIYRDTFGTVIYVGKASNLRRRMSQYFQPSRAGRQSPKLRSLIHSIASWECITVRNEDESLILETRLIKKYAPKYNVLMRDDKRMLSVKIDLSEEFPTPRLARLRKDDSCLYFGPFPHGGLLKQTMEFLIRFFHLRFCRTREPKEEDRIHCLAAHVNDCPCPCVGAISKEEYRKNLDALMEVLNGKTAPVLASIREKMEEEASKRRFEKAAALRDISQNIESLYKPPRRDFADAAVPAHGSGAASVESLRRALKLKNAPNYMICFDNSTISGTLSVASMVVFRNGEPAKNEYKHFRIRTVEGVDDFAMMKEVISRHFTRVLAGEHPLPDLMVVDGGKGQLSYALEALTELKSPPFALIGLAKRNEEIFLPGRSEPIVLPKDSSALQLLQAIRDESHRFAITYNRLLRLRAIQNSLLDEVPNIGETRKKAILEAFGSVVRLRKATPEEIAEKVPGIGPEMAQNLYKFLQDHPATGTMDIL